MDITQLFNEHHLSLSRYLLRFTGDADLAAEAAQEAYVKALKKPPATVYTKAWLYAVATNAAREAARTRHRRWRILTSSPGRAPMGDAPADPHDLLEGDDRRRAVQDALLTLSENERTAILMMQEGFAQREIAHALELSTGTVGKLLTRTIQKLATRLRTRAEDLT
jgi:RNA polymerase sigma-70 factor (ECF subfamily)